MVTYSNAQPPARVDAPTSLEGEVAPATEPAEADDKKAVSEKAEAEPQPEAVAKRSIKKNRMSQQSRSVNSRIFCPR